MLHHAAKQRCGAAASAAGEDDAVSRDSNSSTDKLAKHRSDCFYVIEVLLEESPLLNRVLQGLHDYIGPDFRRPVNERLDLMWSEWPTLQLDLLGVSNQAQRLQAVRDAGGVGGKGD